MATTTHTHKRYKPTIKDPLPDFELILADKVFNAYSWKRWQQQRVREGKPVYRNQLQALSRTLLDGFHSSQLTFNTGAYFPLQTLLEFLLSFYHHFNAIAPHPNKKTRTIDIKVSWDNRLLFGKNQAFSLSLRDTPSSQSSQHVHNFAIASGKETTPLIRQVATECGLDDFLAALEDSRVVLGDEDFPLDYFISVDWISLVMELGDCGRPATADESEIVCAFCGANKKLLRRDWLQDPFKFYTTTLSIADFPSCALPSVPLHKRRYCWMHGITNMLVNCLRKAYFLLVLPSAMLQFKRVMEDCHVGYDPAQRTKHSLAPIEMKFFFQHKLHELLAPLFTNNQHPHSLPWNGPYIFSITTQQMIFTLLDSIRVYYHFGYTLFPNPQNFDMLLLARNTIVSVHAYNEWQLEPSLHWMLNEGIEYAKEDGTAFHTLQEGVEHSHVDDKKARFGTMKTMLETEQGYSCWQQILNTQHLQKILAMKNKAQEYFKIKSTEEYNTPYTAMDITPPLYAPSYLY